MAQAHTLLVVVRKLHVIKQICGNSPGSAFTPPMMRPEANSVGWGCAKTAHTATARKVRRASFMVHS